MKTNPLKTIGTTLSLILSTVTVMTAEAAVFTGTLGSSQIATIAGNMTCSSPSYPSARITITDMPEAPPASQNTNGSIWAFISKNNVSSPPIQDTDDTSSSSPVTLHGGTGRYTFSLYKLLQGIEKYKVVAKCVPGAANASAKNISSIDPVDNEPIIDFQVIVDSVVGQ